MVYMQHWLNPQWEELKNPIKQGGGREYGNKRTSPDLTKGREREALSGAKRLGFFFFCNRPLTLKGQRMQFIVAY